MKYTSVHEGNPNLSVTVVYTFFFRSKFSTDFLRKSYEKRLFIPKNILSMSLVYKSFHHL